LITQIAPSGTGNFTFRYKFSPVGTAYFSAIAQANTGAPTTVTQSSRNPWSTSEKPSP
jgi:hypothetical protein